MIPSDLDDADELAAWLPLAQAAQVAEVSVRTLQRWAAAGRLLVVDGRVLERQLLDTERAARSARHRGAAGRARPRFRRVAAASSGA